MHTLYDSDCFAVVHTALMDVQAPAADFVQAILANHGLAGAAPLDAMGAMAGGAGGIHGFEIVDKRSNKEVYLHGAWAETFQRQINAWRLDVPTQEEVEETLGGYAELAQTPLVIH